MITLTIDGRIIQAAPGATVMEAALAHGIDIPRLCYHPELAPSGGCRLCLIEVEGRPAPQPSCGMLCADGLVVHTQSERLTTLRREILDLFVSDHPLRCVICDKNGRCDLQRYAYQYGIAESSFEVEYSRLLYQDDNPFFIRDHQYCILCSRCVRFTREISKSNALGIVERGNHAFVETVESRPFDDPYSDNVIELCPVGALLSRDFL